MTVTARELARTKGTTYLSPFEEIERWFNKAWGDPFGMITTVPVVRSGFDVELPRLDMYTEGDELVLKVDLPGLKKEDITVEVVDNVLSISGERKTEKKVEKGKSDRSHVVL